MSNKSIEQYLTSELTRSALALIYHLTQPVTIILLFRALKRVVVGF